LVWTKTHAGSSAGGLVFFRVAINFMEFAHGFYLVTYHESGSVPTLVNAPEDVSLGGETGFSIKVVGTSADDGVGILSVRTT